jgi:hypothetical protein
MGTLRKWFGPSREEVWRQLSDSLHSRFIEGGFFKSDRVEAEHGLWTVTLDTYTVSTGKATIIFTRMRAPYVNPDGFRFTIYRKGFFSEIAKWFGMQDIVVGDPVFDEAFIIKGNDERKVRALFADPQLRALVAAQPDIHFEVKDDERWFGKRFPEGVDELYFQVTGRDQGRRPPASTLPALRRNAGSALPDRVGVRDESGRVRQKLEIRDQEAAY